MLITNLIAWWRDWLQRWLLSSNSEAKILLHWLWGWKYLVFLRHDPSQRLKWKTGGDHLDIAGLHLCMFQDFRQVPLSHTGWSREARVITSCSRQCRLQVAKVIIQKLWQRLGRLWATTRHTNMSGVHQAHSQNTGVSIAASMPAQMQKLHTFHIHWSSSVEFGITDIMIWVGSGMPVAMTLTYLVMCKFPFFCCIMWSQSTDVTHRQTDLMLTALAWYTI